MTCTELDLRDVQRHTPPSDDPDIVLHLSLAAIVRYSIALIRVGEREMLQFWTVCSSLFCIIRTVQQVNQLVKRYRVIVANGIAT